MNNKFVPLGILVIALLALLVVFPMMGEIRDATAKVQGYKNGVKELEAKKDKLRSFKAKLTGREEEIEALKLAMPASQQIPEVLVMMESIANNVGLQVSGVNIQPSESGGEVGVTLSAEGTYDNLFKFTQVLEGNLRPISIKSMSIGASGNNNQLISASVNLGILYQGTVNQQVAN